MKARNLIRSSTMTKVWIGTTQGAPHQPMANVGRDEIVMLVDNGIQLSYFVWSKFTHEWEAKGHFEDLSWRERCLQSLSNVRSVGSEAEIAREKDRLLMLLGYPVTETEWQPAPQKVLCHHTWQTTSKEERPGFRKFTQTCPACGKVRVLDRRVLEPLPKKPMTQRPPKSNCQHIWIGTGQEVNSDGSLTKYTHQCPNCSRIKTTTRRTLPRLRTEMVHAKAQEVAAVLLDS